MENYYNFVHSIGWHLYTIPTWLCIIATIVVGLVHVRKDKKRREESRSKREGTEV